LPSAGGGAAAAHLSHRGVGVHSDGRSRLFGFVGYRTEKEAKAAMNFFNNTFIDTSKISIEMARPVRTRAPSYQIAQD
jgi:RNA recognition motif-containing protein